MDNTIDKDSIMLDIAEKENVANALIRNFASQCMNIAQAETEQEINEFRVGLKIASEQLGKFVSTLLMENGNLQLTCSDLDYKKKHTISTP
jgi:uncharacterized Rossmann fold enzyme